MLKVKDIMTKKVLTTKRHATVLEAATVMESIPVSCLVIIDKDKPVGIISERDIIKDVVVQQKDPSKISVKEVMKSPVITVESDEDYAIIIEVMKENCIRRLPVTENGKLVGIVTETNVVNATNKMEKDLAKKLKKGNISLKKYSTEHKELVKKIHQVKSIYKKIGTGSESLNNLLGGGFPYGKNILLEGPPGSGKSMISFSFIADGLKENDTCIYICYNQRIGDIRESFQPLGIDLPKHENKNFFLIDIALKEKKDLGHKMIDTEDDTKTKYLFYIKKTIEDTAKNHTTNIRCVIDIVSQILMFWRPLVVYKFVLELSDFLKNLDATSLFLIQKGMQDSRDVVSIEQLMDGAMELSTKEKGEKIMRHLIVKKMKTEKIIPQKYYHFNFVEDEGIVISDIEKKIKREKVFSKEALKLFKN